MLFMYCTGVHTLRHCPGRHGSAVLVGGRVVGVLVEVGVSVLHRLTELLQLQTLSMEHCINFGLQYFRLVIH